MRIAEITLHRVDLPLTTPYRLSYRTFEGIVTLTCGGHVDAKRRHRSRGCSHLTPLFEGFVAELSERAAGDQMALRVEGVVDGGMSGQKSLR